MRIRYGALFALAVSAVFLAGGCAAKQPAPEGAAPPVKKPAETAGTAAPAGAGAGPTFSDLFSARDLSGKYEESEAAPVVLTGNGAETSSGGVKISGSTVTVTQEGTYILTGTLDGSVVVDAGKEAKVQLVLDGVTLRPDTFAAIYVKQADKVFITLAEGTVSTLSGGETFTQTDGTGVDAVIFSRDDLTLNGTGTLEISAPGGHGIAGKDEVTVTGGTYRIEATGHAISGKDSVAIAGGSFTLDAEKDGLHAGKDAAGDLGSLYIAGGDFVIRSSDDAIHATHRLQIDGGTFDITASEGLEATVVQINGGEIKIWASDDGINAGRKSGAADPVVEFNGGTTVIEMGPGDTDGVDSNWDIIVNGGTVSVTGRSTFDYDGTALHNGGTVIVNGETVTEIPNQFGGWHG